MTFFLSDSFVPDPTQLAALAERQVAIERVAVTRIEGHADVVLRDGRVLPIAGLFVASQMRKASPIASQLGCEIASGAVGDYVFTDAHKASSVAGVFCCGDMARAAGNVALAVADGAMAGVAAHRSLIPQLCHAP